MRETLANDWIRVAYYERMTTICKELFSHRNDRLDVLEYAEYKGILPVIIEQFVDIRLFLAGYPEYDIQQRQFLYDAFDVVIADQVLEHVPCPWQAIKQCVSITKPDGILIFGSPWVYPYHAVPKEGWLDYWRISPEAYRTMFEEFGVEAIEMGGWGHKEALIFGCQTDAFLTPNCTVEMGERAGLFEVQNDPAYAIEVWAMGRKR